MQSSLAIAYLNILPPAPGKSIIHELTKPVHLLGRIASVCDIVIPCRTISRVHCTFVARYTQSDPFYQLIDGERNFRKPSTNGVFVNGMRVEEIWERLNHNDVITFGGCPYKVNYVLVIERTIDLSKETATNADE